MFDSNFDITGVHANYLKDLCELRGNVPDKDQHSNFKIFKSYVDAYTVCPLIGYQNGRKGKMGKVEDGDVGILAEQIINRSKELRYVYQVLMLIDEESEPDKEKRIYRSFLSSAKTEEDSNILEENMRIFNEYFLGGVEVMHEQFVEKCIDQDQYLLQMFQYAKQFNEEQDGDALKAGINKLLEKM